MAKLPIIQPQTNSIHKASGLEMFVQHYLRLGSHCSWSGVHIILDSIKSIKYGMYEYYVCIYIYMYISLEHV